MRHRRLTAGLCAAALAAALGAAMGGTALAAGMAGNNKDLVTGPGVQTQEAGQQEAAAKETAGGADAQQVGSFDPERFVLPQEARVLVVVEGTEGTACNVYAYEKGTEGWELRVRTAGWLGLNGMSNHRTEGDKTTPIGVFRMNTPFGQDDPLEGFPANYIKVDESYIWSQDINRLVRDTSASGEQVGTAGYAEHYDYVIDAGYNVNAVPKAGSALFLHCIGKGATHTSGCVAIPKEEMAKVMRLYGTYGDGACYIAQAPEGTFDQIYDTYGANNGLSPEGNFD